MERSAGLHSISRNVYLSFVILMSEFCWSLEAETAAGSSPAHVLPSSDDVCLMAGKSLFGKKMCSFGLRAQEVVSMDDILIMGRPSLNDGTKDVAIFVPTPSSFIGKFVSHDSPLTGLFPSSNAWKEFIVVLIRNSMAFFHATQDRGSCKCKGTEAVKL